MKYAVLVYQGFIGNVFQVDSLNMADYGRNASLLYQNSTEKAEAFAKGLGAAGIVVRSAECDEIGDISQSRWSDNISGGITRNPVNVN
jgi:hypothetical protein